MKIVILTGSPRKKGNSNYLAEQFAKGANNAGHEVFVFDCVKQKVGGCLACDFCGMNGPCSQKDDFTNILRPQLETADMIVLVSPIYYYGLSSQLKAVIDRFYALNGSMRNKKSALLVTIADTNNATAFSAVDYYHALGRYLGWKTGGEVIGKGLWGKADALGSPAANNAYELGKSL